MCFSACKIWISINITWDSESSTPTPRASYLSRLGDAQESVFLTIARWYWCCPSKDHWLSPLSPPPQWWGNWGLVPGTAPPVLLMAEPVDCTKCQLQVARVRFNMKWSPFLKHFSSVLTVMILCFIKNNHFIYSNSNFFFPPELQSPGTFWGEEGRYVMAKNFLYLHPQGKK